MLHANTFLIHDLCTFKKWHLLVRIIVVIIQNIGHSRLLPTLLLPASLQSLSFGCRFPHLLSFRGPTSQELRAPKVLLEVCQVAFLLVLCSIFLHPLSSTSNSLLSCYFKNLLSTEDYNRNGNQCDNQNGFPFHCICKWTMNIWTFCITLYFTKTSLCDTFWLFLVSLCDIYINCDMVMGHFNVPAL